MILNIVWYVQSRGEISRRSIHEVVFLLLPGTINAGLLEYAAMLVNDDCGYPPCIAKMGALTVSLSLTTTDHDVGVVEGEEWYVIRAVRCAVHECSTRLLRTRITMRRIVKKLRCI